MAKQPNWTEDEDNIVKTLYAKCTDLELQKLLPNRSLEAIEHRGKHHGIRKPKELLPKANIAAGKWSDTEDSIIQKYYPYGGAESVHSQMQGRSITAITARASVIGVHILPNHRSNSIPYTDSILAHMTDLEIGYFAGIVDGEGCIRFARVRKKADYHFVYSAKISIVNTNKPMIDWLCSKFTGYTHYKREAYDNHRTTYNWNFTGTNRTIQLCKELAPYLIAKKSQAELLAQGYKHLNPQEREELWIAMRQLKLD